MYTKSQSRAGKGLVGVLCSLAFVAVTAPESRADSVTESLGASAVKITAASPTGVTVCGLEINSPHWSSGAGSVIFKTRILCDKDAQVFVKGRLGYVAGGSPGKPVQGPPEIVATSSQTQNVKGGVIKTYYTPLANGAKVRKSGTYMGMSEGQIMTPCCSNIGSDRTKHVYVTAR